jgi:hypothetical protein
MFRLLIDSETFYDILKETNWNEKASLRQVWELAGKPPCFHVPASLMNLGSDNHRSNHRTTFTPTKVPKTPSKTSNLPPPTRSRPPSINLPNGSPQMPIELSDAETDGSIIVEVKTKRKGIFAAQQRRVDKTKLKNSLAQLPKKSSSLSLAEKQERASTIRRANKVKIDPKHNDSRVVDDTDLESSSFSDSDLDILDSESDLENFRDASKIPARQQAQNR